MDIKELKKHCKDQLKKHFQVKEHELILNIINKLKKESDLKQEMLESLEDSVNSLRLLHTFIHDDLQESMPEEIMITTTFIMHSITTLIQKAKES
jgi:hypothetical protein